MSYLDKIHDIVNSELNEARFEFNNEDFRAKFRTNLCESLEILKSQSDIAEYLITCDKSNNDVVTIEEGSLKFDIFVKESASSETQKKLSWVMTRHSVDFYEI